MNSKKWCLIALVGAILAVLSLAVFNAAADPFGVFGDDWYSYNITNNPRVGKIEYLKKNHEKYDSYIIGCSSTSSYPAEALNEYLDASFYNMIMYGGDMLDVERTAYYLAENYEVKNLVVNIYISNGVNYDEESDKMTQSMHADVDGSSKLLFYLKYAFADPQYALAKLRARKNDKYLPEAFDVFNEETGAYDKRERDAEKVSDMESFLEDYPVFAAYPQAEYHLPKYRECAQSLGRVRDFCDEKGINLIFVNAPLYYEYFLSFEQDEVERYYSAMAQEIDFWDFSVSSVSLDPRYFYDATHFRNDVGRMALARVFGDDSRYVPQDFGTLVTSENVSEHVKSLYGKTFDDSGYTKKLPVLLYHHIAEEANNDVTVSPEKFEEDMKTLSDNGYTAVTLDHIINYLDGGADLPEKPILITFDDGYMSNYQYAYPVLAKYGMKAVIFAVGETFGADTYPDTDVSIFPHFGENERKEMEESGVIEVQSHSYAMHQNADLETGIPCENMLIREGEADGNYVKRIKEDVDSWTRLMGGAPKAVAFPHGKGDLLTVAALNECGVRLTFSTEHKADTLLKGVALSGNAIGRFAVSEQTCLEELLK